MSTNKQMIRFFTFSQFHNKRPVAGSTHIRVEQLIKYWPESDLYKYGENPDVLILQKVYTAQDYPFLHHFKGKKILDICDPDWMNGFVQLRDTIEAVDAVTCPTEALRSFLAQMTDKPVVVVPDRFDIEALPEPKKHRGEARSVVWFGYSHNSESLKTAIPTIERLKLNLIMISDDDPIAHRWGLGGLKDYYSFIKYDEETIYEDLQRADFAILPKGNRPVDVFKSENKTVKAQLAGLPVATNLETLNQYMNPEERQAFVDGNWKRIREDYDVRRSVEQYKELIKQLCQQ